MCVQDVYHKGEESFANGTNDREACPKRWIAVLVQMNCEKKQLPNWVRQVTKLIFPYSKKYINGVTGRKKSTDSLCQWSCLFVQQ